MIAIKPRKVLTIALTLAAVAVIVLATSLPAEARGRTPRGLGRVRAATGAYHDVNLARHDGYALLTDAAGIACIDNPGVGAMGVHYANGELIGTGAIDAVRPQVLVYAPTPDGGLRLAAVEYVVFQAAWDASHGAPPALFGKQFMLTPDGNRFGLPAFYSLHAWIWERNPSGVFSMWNPRVSCDEPATGQYDSMTSAH